MTSESKARLVKVLAKWLEGECSGEGFMFWTHDETPELLASAVESVIDFAERGAEEKD